MNRTDEMHQAKLNRMYNTTKPHSFVRLGITCRECGNLEGHRLHKEADASALARTAASAQKQSPASQTQVPSPPEDESPDAAATVEGSQEGQS